MNEHLHRTVTLVFRGRNGLRHIEAFISSVQRLAGRDYFTYQPTDPRHGLWGVASHWDAGPRPYGLQTVVCDG